MNSSAAQLSSSMRCLTDGYNNLQTVLLVLVLDGDILASGVLVLAADEIADLLVFGLLSGALVVLRTLAEEFFLDEVDSLVKAVFLLLALPATASHSVELVHEAARLLLLGLVSGRGCVVVIVVASSKVLDEIHDERCVVLTCWDRCSSGQKCVSG